MQWLQSYNLSLPGREDIENNICHPEDSPVDQWIGRVLIGSEEQHYQCFEVHPLFAMITLSFIFAPAVKMFQIILGEKTGASLVFPHFLLSMISTGLVFPADPVWAAVPIVWSFILLLNGALCPSHIKRFLTKTIRMPWKILGSVVILLLSPLITLVWYFRVIIPHNDHVHLKHLRVRDALNVFLNGPQIIFQTFIVLTKAPRYLSYSQWAVLVSSFISFLYSQIVCFLVRRNGPQNFSRQFLDFLKFLPLFVLTTTFKMLTLSVLTTFTGVYVFPILSGLFLIYISTNQIYKTRKNLEGGKFDVRIFFTAFAYKREETRHYVEFNKFSQMMMFLLYSSVIIMIPILVLFVDDVTLSFFGYFKVHWEKLYIVMSKFSFFLLISSNMLLGILYMTIVSCFRGFSQEIPPKTV